MFKFEENDNGLKFIPRNNNRLADYILRLINNAAISVEEKYQIESWLEREYILDIQIDELIEYLKDRQKDLILSGESYTQTDILNHLNKLS